MSDRRARLLLDAGLLDVEFYAALRGRAFVDDLDAARDAVETGMPAGLPTHPLVDVLALPQPVRRAWRAARVGVVLEELELPEPAPLLRSRLIEAAGRIGSGAGTTGAAPGDAARTAGRTSVLLTAYDDRVAIVRTVGAVLATGADDDIEVVVVDDGSAPYVAISLAIAFVDEPRVRLVREPVHGESPDWRSVAIGASTGDVVVILAAGCRPRGDWSAQLRAGLDDPTVAGVQALLLGPDETIRGIDGLIGHPPEDALALDGERLTTRLTVGVALRATDGPDSRPGGIRLAAGAWVTIVDEVEPAAVERGSAPTAPGARWGIRIASTAGHWGDAWGDTHFAAALARGLRECGHHVVTHRAGAHETEAARLDDVALFLRGRVPVAPLPGRTNLLWVISHPEEIEPAELVGYDAVLAASATWASEMSARSGVPVLPLLQATEVAPDPEPRVAEAVFVGTAHERTRPLVEMAVASGIPLAVHGAEWDHLPPGVWRSAYVPNDELPQVYARHTLVLADHWPDMARQGFVANRVFDAVAAGALVACDDVRGAHDHFGPEVVVCRTPDDLRAAYDRSVEAAGSAGLEAAADRVRAEDSFLARARELTELVAGLVP